MKKYIFQNQKPRKKYKLVTNDKVLLLSYEKDNIEIEYFLYLLKKYCTSKGVTFEKNTFNTTEFKEWLDEYIKITKQYADFLKAHEINLDDSSVAEVGKGKKDSIIGTESIEISKFASTMERPKIEFGNKERGLVIYNGKIGLTLDDLGIGKLITQNPNEFKEVNNFSTFSKELRKKIVFGVYGNFSDLDVKQKMKMIKTLLEDTDNTKFEFDTDNDYFYIVVHTAKTKKLSL